jgi:hypothetical protein
MKTLGFLQIRVVFTPEKKQSRLYPLLGLKLGESQGQI